MTYKNMMKCIVGRDSANWVESFIETKEKGFATSEEVEFEMIDGFCHFHARIRVYGDEIKFNNLFEVGGTIDENGIVYKSVIKDWNNSIVWASTETLRKILEIENFKIA